MGNAHHSTEASDGELRTAIVGMLDEDLCVPGPHIGVTVTDHVVTLTGTVHHESERAAAVAAVRRVGGVLTVVDDIVVADAGRLDMAEHEIALWWTACGQRTRQRVEQNTDALGRG